MYNFSCFKLFVKDVSTCGAVIRLLKNSRKETSWTVNWQMRGIWDWLFWFWSWTPPWYPPLARLCLRMPGSQSLLLLVLEHKHLKELVEIIRFGLLSCRSSNVWVLHLFERMLIAKGQIISECPYEKIVSPKIPISEISALASKERSNQKLY